MTVLRRKILQARQKFPENIGFCISLQLWCYAVGTAPRGRPCPGIVNGQNPGIENGRYPDIKNGQAQGPVPTGLLSLSDVIERFKTLITKQSNATKPEITT